MMVLTIKSGSHSIVKVLMMMKADGMGRAYENIKTTKIFSLWISGFLEYTIILLTPSSPLDFSFYHMSTCNSTILYTLLNILNLVLSKALRLRD